MQEMQQLVSQLNKYAYDYYVLDNPRISDGEYDALYDKLLLLEKGAGRCAAGFAHKKGGRAGFRGLFEAYALVSALQPG